MFLQAVSKRPESPVEYTHSESSINTALPIVVSICMDELERVRWQETYLSRDCVTSRWEKFSDTSCIEACFC